MDSTPPPYNRQSKSRRRQLLLEETPSSPQSPVPLLLLSPSPLRRSAKAFLDMPDDAAAGAASRRRCKPNRAPLLGCASPARRSRRRSEVADDTDGVVSANKPRKRRHSVARSAAKKDKLALLLSSSSSSPLLAQSPKPDEDIQPSLDRIWQLMNDLVMWRDVAKSSLWFGLGSFLFLSSCFAQGLSFSAFSVISKMGFLFLGVSFFSNSICQRNGIELNREYRLKEEDILRIAKLILPFANLAISKTRGLFSGDPSTTLKVAPLLLLGSECGHVITLWRLCAIGFFFAFTVPKIYSFYSVQISQKVENLGWRAFEAWGTCPHKKVVAASAVTAFWNLSTIKTRIFAAFISLVLIRYCQEHIAQEIEDDKEAAEGAQEIEDDKEAAEGEENPEQALVLANSDCPKNNQ